MITQALIAILLITDVRTGEVSKVAEYYGEPGLVLCQADERQINNSTYELRAECQRNWR